MGSGWPTIGHMPLTSIFAVITPWGIGVLVVLVVLTIGTGVYAGTLLLRSRDTRSSPQERQDQRASSATWGAMAAVLLSVTSSLFNLAVTPATPISCAAERKAVVDLVKQAPNSWIPLDSDDPAQEACDLNTTAERAKTPG